MSGSSKFFMATALMTQIQLQVNIRLNKVQNSGKFCLETNHKPYT